VNQYRCAAYVRVSTTLQNPLSPEDQLRKCQEFATRQGWLLLESEVYADEAVSGVGADRPGLNRLMEAATSLPRPFDILLIDDSSRLSRNLSDAMRIFERLNFVDVRVIAVSQGIDSQNEQADVLVTVHGLMDSLYVKELAKKTHRGM
jgi:site-specific DNA recombinase